jgi:hypothetical protein
MLLKRLLTWLKRLLILVPGLGIIAKKHLGTNS